MKIRPLIESDLIQVQELIDKYYSDYQYPDLMKLLNAFIIEDNEDNIIMVGGLKLIAEGYLITDKSKSEIQIGRALIGAQKISEFTCKKFNIKNLLAFTDNDSYSDHLMQHGFIERKEKALELEIE